MNISPAFEGLRQAPQRRRLPRRFVSTMLESGFPYSGRHVARQNPRGSDQQSSSPRQPASGPNYRNAISQPRSLGEARRNAPA